MQNLNKNKLKSLKSLSLLLVIFFFTSDILLAQSKGDKVNFSGKGGYVIFTSDNVDGVRGWFVGGSVYGRVFNNLYLGGEFSYIKTSFTYYETRYSYTFSRYFTYYKNVKASIIPLEVNLKYSLEAVSFLVFDFGGGFSFNRLHLFDSLGKIDTKWLWGVQPFVNMNFKFSHFFLGLNLKYQYIQKYKEYKISPSNFRIGAHIGGLF